MTDLRTVAQQALEALEAMQSYAAAERKGLRICDEAITALRAALAEPQEPWEHLKHYGYAPGNYMSRCCICDKLAYGVDKRAITCRPCAEIRHAESHKAEPNRAQRMRDAGYVRKPTIREMAEPDESKLS